MENSKLKIHFGYIVGILLAIIVLLMVYKFSENINLVNYISFAAGITSIFLAVISIVYAFYSNISQTSTLGKIDIASANLNRASEEIKDSSEKLSNELEELRQIIESIPDNIEKISSKIDSTNELLSNNNLSETNTDTISNEQLLNIFYKNFSIFGMLGLYIACLCKDFNKDFNCETIDVFNPNQTIGLQNIYYLYGCFITLSSLNILRLETDFPNSFIFKISYLQEGIQAEDIKKELEERDDSGQKDSIRQINEYFGVKN